jgi:hypothetical protein
MRLDFSGVSIAFAGALLIGAGWRVTGLAALSAGLLLYALHAIIEREVRFGRMLRSSHFGSGAVLRGVSLVVISAAFALAAWREWLAPGTLAAQIETERGSWTMGFFAGLAGFWFGAAVTFGRAPGTGRLDAWLSIPRRIFGVLMMVVALAVTVLAGIRLASSS